MQKDKIPYVSSVVFIINLIVFFYMEIRGSTYDTNFLLEYGALNFDSFFTEKNYFCVISHIFMHIGIEHLVYNMFLLLVIGYYIEKLIGRVQYACIYIFSGVFAGGMSLAWDFYTNNHTVSVGASGAVYGITGALFAYILTDKRLFDEIGIGRLVLFLFFTLYVGSNQEGVNYVAHIAGFIAGCLVTCLVLWCRKGRKEKTGFED